MSKIVRDEFVIEKTMKQPASRNTDYVMIDKDNPIVFLDVVIGAEKGIAYEVIKYCGVIISLQRENNDFIIIII